MPDDSMCDDSSEAETGVIDDVQPLVSDPRPPTPAGKQPASQQAPTAHALTDCLSVCLFTHAVCLSSTFATLWPADPGIIDDPPLAEI